jgi:hypothetical protein
MMIIYRNITAMTDSEQTMFEAMRKTLRVVIRMLTMVVVMLL